MAWDFVGHMIHPDNLPSQAVAQRLGSRLVDMVTLPPPMDAAGPTQMWGQTAEDWRQSASSGALRSSASNA